MSGDVWPSLRLSWSSWSWPSFRLWVDPHATTMNAARPFVDTRGGAKTRPPAPTWSSHSVESVLVPAREEGERLARLGGCALVYIDCGANKGDSLEDLAAGRVGDLELGSVLAAARGGAAWMPSALRTTCAQAFEMNSFHTVALGQVQRTLGPRFRDLRIYTETALVGDAHQGTVRFSSFGAHGGKDRTAAHLATDRTAVHKVQAINLADFVTGLLVGLNSSSVRVVMRIDVEGSEYSLLPDLAASGVGRRRPTIYLAIEWHRYNKQERTVAFAYDSSPSPYSHPQSAPPPQASLPPGMHALTLTLIS